MNCRLQLAKTVLALSSLKDIIEAHLDMHALLVLLQVDCLLVDRWVVSEKAAGETISAPRVCKAKDLVSTPLALLLFAHLALLTSTSNMISCGESGNL